MQDTYTSGFGSRKPETSVPRRSNAKPESNPNVPGLAHGCLLGYIQPWETDYKQALLWLFHAMTSRGEGSIFNLKQTDRMFVFSVYTKKCHPSSIALRTSKNGHCYEYLHHPRACRHLRHIRSQSCICPQGQRGAAAWYGKPPCLSQHDPISQ